MRRTQAYLPIKRLSSLALAVFAASTVQASDPIGDFLEFYNDESTGNYLKGDLSIVTAQFFQHSAWAGNDKELLGDNSSFWGEYGISAGISGDYWLRNGSHFEARFSGVYSATEHGLDAGGSNLDSDGSGYEGRDKATIEEAYIRWRSGSLYSNLGKDAIEISVGSQVYKQGTGFLFYDAGSDGGDRGGFWLGMRKAYQYAAIARLRTGNWMAETYYLQPDSPGVKTDMAGANVEYDFDGRANVGVSYTNIYDSDDDRRDGLDIYDLRLGLQPFEQLPNLRLDGELAKEKNGDDNDSLAAYGRVSYSFDESIPWQPRLYYRYAHFSGDDGEGKNEAFDPINYGFNDWNEWFIGEITGEYVTSNSNLNTHTLNLAVTPHQDVDLGLYYIYYRLDEKSDTIAPRPPTNPRDALIHDRDLGHEINLTADWDINEHLYLGVMAGLMIPEDGAKDFFGDDENWGVLMINLGYSF